VFGKTAIPGSSILYLAVMVILQITSDAVLSTFWMAALLLLEKKAKMADPNFFVTLGRPTAFSIVSCFGGSIHQIIQENYKILDAPVPGSFEGQHNFHILTQQCKCYKTIAMLY